MLEVSERSVLKGAEFCKCLFKHILPALVESRAVACPVAVCRIVSMSDVPETARNTEKAKSDPTSLPAWLLLVRASAAQQPRRPVSQLLCVWQALAETIDKRFPFLGLLLVRPGNPKVLLAVGSQL